MGWGWKRKYESTTCSGPRHTKRVHGGSRSHPHPLPRPLQPHPHTPTHTHKHISTKRNSPHMHSGHKSTSTGVRDGRVHAAFGRPYSLARMFEQTTRMAHEYAAGQNMDQRQQPYHAERHAILHTQPTCVCTAQTRQTQHAQGGASTGSHVRTSTLRMSSVNTLHVCSGHVPVQCQQATDYACIDNGAAIPLTWSRARANGVCCVPKEQQARGQRLHRTKHRRCLSEQQPTVSL